MAPFLEPKSSWDVHVPCLAIVPDEALGYMSLRLFSKRPFSRLAEQETLRTVTKSCKQAYISGPQPERQDPAEKQETLQSPCSFGPFRLRGQGPHFEHDQREDTH